MPQRITINPLTRISGFMEIEADIDNHRVVDTKTKGAMFRGFESMLIGRNPFDAVYFTQRICGICSTAHSVASSLALENALNIVPSQQGRYLRDIIHCCEFLQNHLRHFYQLILPDFVKLPEDYPLFKTQHRDFRLPKSVNDKLVESYFQSLDISRLSHKALAILGGKAPHNHGVFIGGITTSASADMILAIDSILTEINQFIDENMIPAVYELAKYYPEYYKIGKGYGNLLTYGCFNNYKELGTLFVDSLVMTDNVVTKFDSNNITQENGYSFFGENNEPDIKKPNAYTWIKAPRYNNLPYEVGPLARMYLSGEYKNGISTMDRIVARVLESKKIICIMKTLLKNLIPDTFVQDRYALPEKASSKGLVDTSRGALGHWLEIVDSKIGVYQIITPSAWNLSAQTENMKGVAEKAIIGAPVEDISSPVEIGRIVRSFDPCVSCATHVFLNGKSVGITRAV